MSGAMRVMMTLGVMVCGCVGTSCGSKAPPPPPPTAVTPAKRENAAPEYMAIAPTLVRQIGMAMGEAGTPNLNALLVQHQPEITRLIEATRLPDCDFGVDWSKGLEAEMPQLGSVRGLARALKTDGERLIAAGDIEGAAVRAAALLRLATHISMHGGSQIELLIAIVVAQLGVDFVNANPKLSSAAAKSEIQQALSGISANGTLNAMAILRSEATLTPRSLRDGTGIDMKMVGGRDWSKVSAADREVAAKKLEALWADTLVAWEGPGPVAALEKLSVRAKTEGVSDLFVGPDKIRKSFDALRAAIGQANAMLRK